MFKVGVVDDFQSVAASFANWQALDDCDVEFVVSSGSSASQRAARLHDYNAIVAMRERTQFDRDLLSRLTNLRLLITSGSRNAAIDLSAADDLGIVVCGTRGLGYPAAELAWGMMLAISRGIPEEQQSLRTGKWQSGLGVGLQGKTLGLLGLGAKGLIVAGYARAFGMKISAWSQNLTSARAKEAGAVLVDRDELLATADFLMIQLLLSDRTRGLIGEREISLMKKSAFLINTSRGPIVDEAALVSALRSKTIRGAALDVFDVEPIASDNPLLSLDNVLLTPHLGYATEENYRIFYGDAVEAIEAYRQMRPVRVMSAPKTDINQGLIQ